MKTILWCLFSVPVMASAATIPSVPQQQLQMQLMMQNGSVPINRGSPSPGGGGIPVIDVAAIKQQAWENYKIQADAGLSYEEWDKQVWREQNESH